MVSIAQIHESYQNNSRCPTVNIVETSSPKMLGNIDDFDASEVGLRGDYINKKALSLISYMGT